MAERNRWRRTARARMLAAFAIGFWYASYLSWIAVPGWVFLLMAVVNTGWGVGITMSLVARERKEEGVGAFVARLAVEHGVDATFGVDRETAPTHITYVVDPETYRRIAEHAFLNDEGAADG